MITWYGKTVCSHGFVINLKTREDRKKSAKEQLKLAGIDGVNFFDAVTIDDDGLWKPYGCTQSHIDLYNFQIKNQIDYMLILEDDISTTFSYSYDDSIKLESQRQKYVSNLLDSFNKLKPDLLWLGCRVENSVDPYDDYISYTNKTLMAHAYLSSLRLAQFCVDNYYYQDSSHLSYRLPIDFFLSQIKLKDNYQIVDNKNNHSFINNNLIIGISNCLIFNQKADYSNIIERPVDYSIWVTGCHQEYCFNQIKEKINYHEYI
jgi:GR25 family glycosyltransferase involved in LPS biosynthesis